MRIIYATDGSEGALAGAEFLTVLPLEAEHRITVLAVAERGDAAQAQAAVEASRQALSHSTATLETLVREGHVADEILRAAEAGADLVVVGSRGRSAIARFFLGSVAERVARHAACPVLLVRPLRNGLKTAMVGIDGSRSAENAAEWLRGFPLPPGTELRFFSALPPYEVAKTSFAAAVPPIGVDLRRLQEEAQQQARDRLRDLAAKFAADGRRTATELREGIPATALVQAAQNEGADLIVVGAHGQGAVERFLMGSVSENVLRHAACSVLVVKAPPGSAS